MNCTHCNKRLSQKTARQIDGVIMCSPCMFAPRKSGVTRQGQDPQGLDREAIARGPAKQDAP